MIKCFKNANILLPERGVVNTSVTFGERITEIDKACGQKIALPQGAYVLPGFIDIHVHGACGFDFMDADKNAYSVIDGALASEGTCRYLATTMTQSSQKIRAALECAAEFKNDGNGLVGVHLEGPFISSRNAGAQSADYICRPDQALFENFYSAARGCIKTVTVAAEWDNSAEFANYLKDKGISVSIGHSAASIKQIERIIAAGADKITHAFNAQSGLHHRDIGVAGAALLYDGLYTEIIADGVHVSYPAIRLLLKCKPREKVILITDSMRAKGADEGESELGGQKVFIKDGEARLADGTLAGSVLKMNRAVKNLVENLGVPIETAAEFASLNPAKYLGLNDCGKIAVNNYADFAVIDANYEVLLTVRGGEIIYSKL